MEDVQCSTWYRKVARQKYTWNKSECVYVRGRKVWNEEVCVCVRCAGERGWRVGG